jgi:NitT/TauT family transport system substrate-binding protein
MRLRAQLTVVLLVTALVAGVGIEWLVAPGQAQRPLTRVRVDLGWTLQGPHAPFFIALERGYFAREGIAAEIHPGTGAPDQIRKMAAGLFDAGLLDLVTLTEFKIRERVPIIAVYGVYNNPGIATIALRRHGITRPRDLEGRRIGAPLPDVGFRLFPAFAARTGIDMARITFEPVTFALREPALVDGRVHAITGLLHSVLGVRAMGVPDDDIVIFDYKQHGVEVYGAGIAFTEEFIRRNPAVITPFLRALTRGYEVMIRDPEHALAVMMRREPLLNARMERDRIQLVVTHMIDTPEVRQHGFGYYDRRKLHAHLATIIRTFTLPGAISVDDLFTDRFFPPAEQRMILR